SEVTRFPVAPVRPLQHLSEAESIRGIRQPRGRTHRGGGLVFLVAALAAPPFDCHRLTALAITEIRVRKFFVGLRQVDWLGHETAAEEGPAANLGGKHRAGRHAARAVLGWKTSHLTPGQGNWNPETRMAPEKATLVVVSLSGGEGGIRTH